MPAKIIMAFLRNVLDILFAVAIITTIAKIARSRSAREVASISYLLWGELLYYTVGIGLIYNGLLHAYVQDTAGNIGRHRCPNRLIDRCRAIAGEQARISRTHAC